jgi:hypothetical protein
MIGLRLAPRTVKQERPTSRRDRAVHWAIGTSTKPRLSARMTTQYKPSLKKPLPMGALRRLSPHRAKRR